MKVLVTGGAGYLGSVLTRKLLENGYGTIVLDNFLYGHKSLVEVIDYNSLNVIEGDVRDLRVVAKALIGVDAVIHLASIVGDQAGNLDPRATVLVNYLATKNLAEMSALYGVKKFIFASTCSVYGDALNHAVRENDMDLQGDPLSEDKIPKPISLYGETKLKSEAALRSTPGLKVIIYRLGTLFGLSPRMRFDLVINLFIAKALRKEKLIVFGGQQNRPFLHVQDAADAIILALRGDFEGIFNIAWKNMKLLDVAKVISNHLDAEFEVSGEVVDRRNYIVSTDKMKEIGIRPTRTVNDAIIEIKQAFDNGLFGNYASDEYSNYKSLFNSIQLQHKIYSLGPMGEKI